MRNKLLFSSIIVFILLSSIFFTLQSTPEQAKDKEFTPLQVVNGVVVIDDEHENDYISTDTTEIFNDLINRGYFPIFSSELGGWENALKYANYFIINAPYTAFTTQEINAMVNWFLNNTSNLLISSRGDFNPVKRSSLNNLLGNISSDMRINDDNVYTTSASARQPWYVSTSNLNDSIPELITNVSDLDLFSPSSIYSLNENNTEIIAYGDGDEYQTDTTDTVPIDVIFDNSSDGVGGESIPLVMHQQIQQGSTLDRIIITGTTMWSDFDYSNNPNDIQFFNNIMSYFTNATLAIDGSISFDVPDLVAPEVSISFPRDQSILKGTINITVNAIDTFGINNTKIYIDDQLRSNTSSYLWDTTLETAGIHNINASAMDQAGNYASIVHTVTINQSFIPSLSLTPKIMEYNIKEGGIDPLWMEVVKEEDPDIVVFVETGNWDDNSDELMNKYITELNAYFIDEVGYKGVVDQGTGFDTTGIAILSRYTIKSSLEIRSLRLDNGNLFNPTHDFLKVTVDINGIDVNVIGSHLKCCSGTSEQNKRANEQEGIINYMDSLGNVPIIYAGDLNSFAPGEGSGGLGSDPVDMLINPSNPSSSKVHTFTDVYRQINPTDPGYSYLSNSRIDFIFVNQLLKDLILNSTVGDTKSGLLGSDHNPVDVILDFSQYVAPPETTTTSSSVTTSTNSTTTSTNSITTTSTSTSTTDTPVNPLFWLGIATLVISKKIIKSKKIK